jgi:prepilin-type N-terminal cleavage/methylation domain-containing protein
MNAHERGFTLIEVLVALAIAGALMLSAAALYWQQKEIGQRLVAERAADEALENAYERLRAGATSLDSTGSEITVTFAVGAGPVPGTTALDIVATYRVHGQPFRRNLQALLHIPAAP